MPGFDLPMVETWREEMLGNTDLFFFYWSLQTRANRLPKEQQFWQKERKMIDGDE